MAVTIDAAGLVAALRLGDSAEELAEATRILAYCREAITKYVAVAPDAIHDEATRRLAGYLYDQPEAARGDAYSNSLRNSGASRMLLPYRLHSGGLDDVAEAQAAIGTANNPVVDVDVVGRELVVTFQDGSIERETLPSDIDQVARDTANSAEATATANALALEDKLARLDIIPAREST